VAVGVRHHGGRFREANSVAESLDDVHPLLLALSFVVADDSVEGDLGLGEATDSIEAAVDRRDARGRVVE
jgi:hypothetical protein